MSDDIDDIFDSLDDDLNPKPSAAEAVDAASSSDGGEVDYMAEMAAAMEADGVPIQDPEELAASMAADADTSSSPDSSGSSGSSNYAGIDGNDVNIEALLKVPVSLSIEVGRTKMALSELLETKEGAVIELERHLDDPLDILVNGALIAHGVVVLANESFGIQITDIISLAERARSL